ncbi:hypothetical protein F5B22DRAFT_643128 [Xylaria bambusicola]|uniref:uncharacterized protein n=1 Tax=Xylaria bambusicola TaxID=326684 RepID=UPI002008AB4D|nr:uncharacterized protein F5B22DRAFT_643128 [Xylaria bambusicola]KAI0522105.1 hypothetical protein F5B22DRAFT_643128 [Xylaria bambusicola]
MRFQTILFGLVCGTGAWASNKQHIGVDVGHHIKEIPSPAPRDLPEPSGHRSQLARGQYPINCHIHGWPSASVDSIKQAYSWFYQLWAPLEADAQHCRRIACFGTSAVWLCADSLGFQKPNSVRIADEMNGLLDGDNGCLDKGDKTKVQGMVFTSEEWSVVVRGGEDCSVEPPEQPIFY